MVFHVDQERTLDGGQDSLFVQSVLHLLQFHNLCLVQYLEGMVGLIGFVFDQHDTTKRPRAQCLDPIKIIQDGRRLGWREGGGEGRVGGKGKRRDRQVMERGEREDEKGEEGGREGEKGHSSSYEHSSTTNKHVDMVM